MTAATILDTETTGLDAPEVIQLAYLGPLVHPMCETSPSMIEQLHFKPSKPISLGALATHHIIAEDLAECDPWPGKWEIPDGIDYIVGHNVDFDWKAIGSPNVKRICTFALARMAFPLLDSHSLGALIYSIYPARMARDMLKNAHNASVDVDLTHALLMSMWSSIGKPASWDELWQISEKARVPTHFTFGKFGPKDGKPGALISEVRKFDRGYIKWCLASCDIVKDDPYWIKALTQ